MASRKTKRTNGNRVHNINMVVEQLATMPYGTTATDISKCLNLSRQAILEILKHAESWGYVIRTTERYRSNTNRHTWSATDYGDKNATWYMQAIRKAKASSGQLPLL